MLNPEFTPQVIRGHKWAEGTLRSFDLMGLSQEEFTNLAAHSDGCPIRGEVIATKGAVEAGRGYVTNNIIGTRNLALVASVNPHLYFELTETKRRYNDEPVGPDQEIGYFEAGTVPEVHTRRLGRQVKASNWISIRLVREAAKALGDPLPETPSLEDLVSEVSRHTITPSIWLVTLAERTMTGPLKNNAPKVLSLVFSQAHYREENCMRDYQAIRRAAIVAAPDLWAEYCRLDASELDRYNILKVAS